MKTLSRRARLAAEMSALTAFFTARADQVRTGQADEGVDLTFGDPHELPLPDLVAAIEAHLHPRSVDWFA